MAERNGIDVSTIKTFDDLEAALAVIKENEPGVVPLIGTESTAAAEYLIPDVDLLGDSLGVLFGDSTEVVNLYASDAYMEMAKRMRDWYLKGYISEDVVRCENCTYVWIRPPGDDDPPRREDGRSADV